MSRVRAFFKNAGKLILFLAIFGVLLSLVMDVLIFKQEDGILPMRVFYELPGDTVDVLLLGSSHVGMNLSVQQLWDDYGIAAYKCWGSTQPVWNTYYYLKECLQYQRPKVVVVDVHGAIFSHEYSDYALQVKNTLGMRLSRNKLDAVKASAPEDTRAALLLGLPTYHMRYGELTRTDFDYFPWDRHLELTALSNEAMDQVFPFEILAPDATSDVEPLAEKEERYLRAVIALCREEGIPLELVAAPYQISEFEQRRFRAVAALAEEYEGLRFTNFNEVYADYGIDPHKDFVDTGHFNRDGVPKYTAAIASLLKRYSLPDRREDPGHIWNRTTDDALRPVYSLEERFTGDGVFAMLDTGLPLYDNPLASWTLLTEFTVPPADDPDRVILSCYDERENHYQGLLVNLDENRRLTVRFSSYEDLYTDRLPEGETIRLAVVKDNTQVTAYVNDESLGTFTLQTPGSYAGNLLLGCQQDGDGSYFRFSRPQIHDLQVFDAALSETQIKSWEPRSLPQPEPSAKEPARQEDGEALYVLPYRFVGDGLGEYWDTGLPLYADPDASWTLLMQYDAEIPSGNTVYLACFLEDPADYHGLLIRRLEPGKLNIVYGQGANLVADIPESGIHRLAIVKQDAAYSVYLDGESVLENAVSPCGSYDGTLLLGCEREADGLAFRFSGTTVYDLELIDRPLTEEAVRQWQPEPQPEVPYDPGTPVEYRMEGGFAGDGISACLDTGVQLYDVPDKSWTLHMLLDLDPKGSGTAVSCFAEDPTNYRGLLVRQIDETTYGLTLGAAYTTVSIGTGRTLTLDIVKDGYRYLVYVDGQLRHETESRVSAWDGALLVDAERMLNGSTFRFSNQKVRILEIGAELLDAETVRARYESELTSHYYQK